MKDDIYVGVFMFGFGLGALFVGGVVMVVGALS